MRYVTYGLKRKCIIKLCENSVFLIPLTFKENLYNLLEYIYIFSEKHAKFSEIKLFREITNTIPLPTKICVKNCVAAFPVLLLFSLKCGNGLFSLKNSFLTYFFKFRKKTSTLSFIPQVFREFPPGYRWYIIKPKSDCYFHKNAKKGHKSVESVILKTNTNNSY